MQIAEIDALQLQQWLNTQPTAIEVIDIREHHEVERGTIAGSRHIPLQQIPYNLEHISREKSVVLLCHSGARSAHACMYLAAQGFGNVINLRGGILSWARQGFDCSKPQVA